MAQVVIEFDQPVAFPVELTQWECPCCSVNGWPELVLENLGEECAVGVNRLGFAPAATALPQGLREFWWFCEPPWVNYYVLSKNGNGVNVRENCERQLDV
ncbi:hypothetical protein GC207_04675 [bacterium]|nr:hypothetical protein [bacterium]